MRRDSSGVQGVEVAALVDSLDLDDLREVVRVASDRHEDVARAVRLAAGRAAGDFQQLRAEIDRGLRTRRFLDYRESAGWAMQAAPVVAEIRAALVASSSATLVALIERAVGHVVKVIAHADDSDGAIGDLARELLDLHAQACDTGVAVPVKLAQWMVRFSCEDQDFFEVDPVHYADALGEPGLAWYRDEIGRRRDCGNSSFAVRYAEERLAVLDGNADAIVALLGGDLSSPYQFVRVATAMAELGRDDDVLAWARRGIRRPAAGRLPSSTIWPPGSTPGSRAQAMCWRCDASNTVERRRCRLTVGCGRQRRPWVCGPSNGMRPGRRCVSAIWARWWTCC